jgi:hypothetical protein
VLDADHVLTGAHSLAPVISQSVKCEVIESHGPEYLEGAAPDRHAVAQANGVRHILLNGEVPQIRDPLVHPYGNIQLGHEVSPEATYILADTTWARPRKELIDQLQRQSVTGYVS